MAMDMICIVIIHLANLAATVVAVIVVAKTWGQRHTLRARLRCNFVTMRVHIHNYNYSEKEDHVDDDDDLAGGAGGGGPDDDSDDSSDSGYSWRDFFHQYLASLDDDDEDDSRPFRVSRLTRDKALARLRLRQAGEPS
jgi:hypothetical protein